MNEETGNNTPDANLDSLVPTTTFNDVCILTFNFVPVCNTISITYEFGSSEYDGYQCSSYNDAFGLFLSGPNPAGGTYASDHNIATVPGTTLAVSINSIHDGVKHADCLCTSCPASNSSYYVANYSGNGTTDDIAYEGLTTAITSTAAVTPCQTYTMEIAIGDAGDEDYDSGIFLKSNSLSCPSNFASTTSPANCGGNTGTASVTVTNYTGTPTYTWSPGGENTSSISNQAAGTYTCTVGLTQCSNTYTQAITAIISPTTTPVTISVTSATICAGETATLTATSNATMYSWTAGVTPTTTNTAIDSVATASPGTTTSYTVKGSSGTCTNSAVATVQVMASPTVTVNNPTICSGSTATLTANGATTYSWTTGLSSTMGSVVTGNPGSTISYSVLGTTGTCTNTAVSTISVTPTPTVTVSSSTICPGGTATLTANGATTYTWSAGVTPNTGSVVTVSPGSNISYTVTGTSTGCTSTAISTVTIGAGISITVPSATICAGTSTTLTASGAINYTWSPATGLSSTTGYSVTANPAVTTTYTVNGATGSCTGTGTTVVTVNPFTATVTTLPTTCTGSTGSATVGVTAGGTAPYSYAWTTTPVQTSSVAVNLAQGSYSVGIMDATGCLTAATGIVGVQGFAWSPTAASTNPLCGGASNGTATVSITNPGTNTFTYSWVTTPAQTNTVATNLSAGTYTVLVTDNNGCKDSTTTTLTNPPPITATVNTSPTICSGSTGSATVTAGGAAPYTYTWTTTPVQTNSVAVGLPKGSCSVSITDNNGCPATATGIVGVQGFTWVPAAASTNPVCIGGTTGTATVSITNPGASTFTYSWTTTPAQTNTVATNLSAGTYTVLVTDNNGCKDSAITTLTNPPPIIASVSTSPTICKGSVGSATVTVLSGGTPQYQYTWVTNPGQMGPVATNLAQGTYSVYITDANACPPVIVTGTVNTTGFTWVPVVSTSPTKCFASSDGTATVTITNAGASTFTAYVWAPSAQTNSVAINLSAGVCSVTVTDNNGCVSTASGTVTQPSTMTLSTQATSAICTASNGTAMVTAIGGTGPYKASWQTQPPQVNTTTATNLPQGQYNVTVTDANNCPAVTTVIVNDSNDLTVTATSSPDLCNKGVGKATAHPTGEQPTYIWSTNPVQTTQTATNLGVGTYSVNVIDTYGCTAAASTTVINQNDILSAQFITIPGGTVYAENPVVLDVATNSGWFVDSLAYLSNGVTINKNPFSYTFPQYGDYTATYYFTSINGCKDSMTYDIIVKDYMTLYIPNTFTPNGDGKNDHFEAQGTFINTFQMFIYDRWGILVKELNSLNTTWDGTKNGGQAPEDTYVYIGSATDIFGNNVSFNGQINLVR